MLQKSKANTFLFALALLAAASIPFSNAFVLSTPRSWNGLYDIRMEAPSAIASIEPQNALYPPPKYPKGPRQFCHRSALTMAKSTHQGTNGTPEKGIGTAKREPSLLQRILGSLAALGKSFSQNQSGDGINPQSRLSLNAMTLLRVGIPSLGLGLAAFLSFPGLSMWLSGLWSQSPGVLQVLSQDSSQFVQNFLTVAGLLFSMLVGQTYYFMYQQQEMLYYALFNEVTEAKSLLEQVALVCQGRSMYPKVLGSIQNYVKRDLKQLQADPAILLSARPIDDPLETIMYLTSVGVPSTVYETVRSLRQARAQRLGALQRKVPHIHILLLWVLALMELISFPLLGAGTQTIGGYNLLTIEGLLFGVMTAGITLTLNVRNANLDWM